MTEHKTETNTPDPSVGRVIVVGASMAGLLAARALADHVAHVVVLEREELGGIRPEADALAPAAGSSEPRPPEPRPPEPQLAQPRAESLAEPLAQPLAQPRGHVPQGRHLHLLLSAGLDRLMSWFPGIVDELESRGAVHVDGTNAWVYQGGAYRARGDWGDPALCLTRPLLEEVVRARVAALPNVTIETGVRVDDVAVASNGAVPKGGGPGSLADHAGGAAGHSGRLRVTGVVVDGVERPADLVVDCSGRASRLVHALESSRRLSPPVSRVTIDIGYASRFLRRSVDDFEGDFLVCQASPPGSFRAGAALPVEGGRWQVTLAGVHGDVPPSDEVGFLEFARSLPSPALAQLLERCEALSPVATYRFPWSQRRHFEKVAHLLPGLVVLGDAACSFDPIYGQGMSSAALQAQALGDIVGRLGQGRLASPVVPRLFHRRAATILDAPWSIAVGGDFQHPKTTGPRARGTGQLNRYVARVVRASHVSVPVAKAFNQVLQLARPPRTLFGARTVARVLTASRRSPSVTGEPVRHPRVGPAAPDPAQV